MLNLSNLFSLGKISELSKNTKISTGNLCDWKSGRSKPSAETLIKIADQYNCSIDYLLGRTNLKQINVTKNTIIDDIIYLPLLEQRSSAGIGKRTGDISNNIDDIRAFPVSNAIKTASHAIIIDGNSMQPEIVDGQIVFIDSKQECNDGDYGIFNVIINGESIVYCKQYKFDKTGKPYLHSVNANAGDPEFSESDEVQIQCVGKIIKW